MKPTLFKNLKLGAKIGLGFATVLVIMIGLAVVAYRSQQGAYANFTRYRQLARENILAGEIRETMLGIRISVINFVFTKSEQNVQDYETGRAALRKSIERAQQEILEPEHAQHIKVISEKFAGYEKDFVELKRFASQKDAAAQFDQVYRQMAAVGPVVAKACADLTEAVTADQVALGAEIKTVSELAIRWLIGISFGALIVGVGLAYVITRSITRPVRQVIEILSAGADQTTAAAGQVSAASQSLAEGASEQAASLEETSSSLEEMSSMTKRNAESAQSANTLASQTRQAADVGANDMQTMNTAMQAIKASSADIAKIIKTIDEIAFQTNILALNAAVEAARAGEAGMGFAVVADEVRSLAQRSAQAAKETAAKIEGAIANTEQGVQISGRVAQGLQEIVGKIRQVDTLVAEVASACKEQSQGIDQINTAVSQMDKVTQSNAASAEESASASEELNAQAEALKEAVGQLVALVGGDDQHQAVKRTAAPAAASRPESHPQLPKSNSKSLKPKAVNGHLDRLPALAPRAPALAPVGPSRGSEIPMKDDFKDF